MLVHTELLNIRRVLAKMHKFCVQHIVLTAFENCHADNSNNIFRNSVTRGMIIVGLSIFWCMNTLILTIYGIYKRVIFVASILEFVDVYTRCIFSSLTLEKDSEFHTDYGICDCITKCILILCLNIRPYRHSHRLSKNLF